MCVLCFATLYHPLLKICVCFDSHFNFSSSLARVTRSQRSSSLCVFVIQRSLQLCSGCSDFFSFNVNCVRFVLFRWSASRGHFALFVSFFCSSSSSTLVPLGPTFTMAPNNVCCAVIISARVEEKNGYDSLWRCWK